MSTTLQMQSPVQTLPLGGITLSVTSYRLKAECPVAKQTLCTGEPRWSLLGMLPCMLSVQGRIAAGEAAALLGALRDALSRQSRFSFTFLGTEFRKMQLSALDYHCAESGQLTEYSITLIGEIGTGGGT